MKLLTHPPWCPLNPTDTNNSVTTRLASVEGGTVRTCQTQKSSLLAKFGISDYLIYFQYAETYIVPSKPMYGPGVLVHACNPSTWEAEVQGSGVQGQP